MPGLRTKYTFCTTHKQLGTIISFSVPPCTSHTGKASSLHPPSLPRWFLDSHCIENKNQETKTEWQGTGKSAAMTEIAREIGEVARLPRRHPVITKETPSVSIAGSLITKVPMTTAMVDAITTSRVGQTLIGRKCLKEISPFASTDLLVSQIFHPPVPRSVVGPINATGVAHRDKEGSAGSVHRPRPHARSFRAQHSTSLTST